MFTIPFSGIMPWSCFKQPPSNPTLINIEIT